MNTQQTLLDVYDAARILLLSVHRVRALVRKNQLPHIALPDGEIRFDAADLSRFVESHKQPVVAGAVQ